MRGRVLENTSDYGTMSNQVEDQLLDDLIPNLNLTSNSLEDEGTVFNDITIEERKERIQSIINDIMSVPKLSEAGLTQRGAISQERLRKYLSHENLSSRNGSSVSGMVSKQPGSKMSNRNSSLKRTTSMNKFEGRKENNINNKREIAIKDSIVPRSHQSRTGTSMTNGQFKANKSAPKPNKDKRLMSHKSLEGGMTVARPPPPLKTKQNMGKKVSKLDSSSMESVPLVGGGLSQERLLGDDTQDELRIHPPTLGDETTDIHQSSGSLGDFNIGFTDDGPTEPSIDPDLRNSENRKSSAGREGVDYLQQNIRALASAQQRKGSGRSTADSMAAGGAGTKHKAGAVPKYLKQRQQQWRDEAQAILDSAPDPDCPPGHVRLPDPDRVEQLAEMQSTHAALLADLNRLPVSSDTRRVTEKRREIEGLLAGLDDGIRIYSRPKVFVKKQD